MIYVDFLYKFLWRSYQIELQTTLTHKEIHLSLVQYKKPCNSVYPNNKSHKCKRLHEKRWSYSSRTQEEDTIRCKFL